MKKKFVFGILCFMLLCLCACVTRNEEELWDVNQYERVEDIISIEKPANKKQVLFSKTFLPKKSITNKPAFFIWFAKIYFHFRLLIYFHYSCIINSQKLIKSCYLCNLTRFPFCLFLSDKVIYRVPTFFLHNQTSHCFKSYLSKC